MRLLADATALLPPSPMRAALLTSLDRAMQSLANGGAPGRAGSGALRRAGRHVMKYAHRLRSLAGRRTVEGATRAALLGLAGPVRDDMRRLRLARR